MIALLCAALICLSGDAVPVPPHSKPGHVLRGDPALAPRWGSLKWAFTMHFYGRDIVIDGWESELDCWDMKNRMQRNFPEARVTDCEESR